MESFRGMMRHTKECMHIPTEQRQGLLQGHTLWELSGRMEVGVYPANRMRTMTTRKWYGNAANYNIESLKEFINRGLAHGGWWRRIWRRIREVKCEGRLLYSVQHHRWFVPFHDDCLHSIAEDLAMHDAGTGDIDWVDSEKGENPTSTEYNMMHANNISSNHNNTHTTHTQRIVVVA